MKPITFPEVNQVFQKPEDMTEEECGSLPVHNTGTQIVSCWELSEEEKLKAVFFGRLWISIIGQSQPPIWLRIDKTVFIPDDDMREDADFLEKYKDRKIMLFLRRKFMPADFESGICFHKPEDMSEFLLEFINSLFQS